MCGRFNADGERLDEKFIELTGSPFPGPSNRNTAPTEDAWVVRERDGERRAMRARWSLTPSWAKTKKLRYATFNARCETMRKSAIYREAFHRRRCVVPVTGFYEWSETRFGRMPHHVRRTDGTPLLLGGLWDRWRDREAGEWLLSFAIVTTPPHPGLAHLHDRQPLMLSEGGLEHWMDADAPMETLSAHFAPALPFDLTIDPVSRYVSDALNKGAQCVEPIGDGVRIEADILGAP